MQSTNFRSNHIQTQIQLSNEWMVMHLNKGKVEFQFGTSWYCHIDVNYDLSWKFNKFSKHFLLPRCNTELFTNYDNFQSFFLSPL